MLKLTEVTKTFGTKKALDRISMVLPRGCVYGLVGPNGAGKTTAIRCALGVYRPDSGTVTLEDAPVYENPEAKVRMAAIPDEVFFFPTATLEDMRKFYRSVYPQFDDGLFDRLRDAFPLQKNVPLRRFSKGMQKQAAFHLSICARPELLVLDEPVDGLDPVMRRQVWSLILSDVEKNGTSVLVSSHNLRELEDICDRVGIMDKGTMLLERSLADLQGSTVKLQLVGATPESLEVLHESSSGRLRTLIVRGDAEAVEAAVQPLHLPYYDILPLSLEEIFIYELGGADYAVKNILL